MLPVTGPWKFPLMSVSGFSATTQKEQRDNCPCIDFFHHKGRDRVVVESTQNVEFPVATALDHLRGQGRRVFRTSAGSSSVRSRPRLTATVNSSQSNRGHHCSSSSLKANCTGDLTRVSWNGITTGTRQGCYVWFWYPRVGSV